MATKIRVVKVKTLAIPPVNLNPNTLLEEAFENLREWRINHKEEISQEDLKWYYNELEEEKQEAMKYFTDNPSYKAIIDSVSQGFDEERRQAAENAVKKDDDPGPMPVYGTNEFWAWCRKRKEIRLKKEAANPGTVTALKSKKKS